jgi:hypothetical protein
MSKVDDQPVLRKTLYSRAVETFLDLLVEEDEMEQAAPKGRKYPAHLALNDGLFSKDVRATILERFRQQSYELESRKVQECIANMMNSPINEESKSIVAEFMFGTTEESLRYSKVIMEMGEDAKDLLPELETSVLLETPPPKSNKPDSSVNHKHRAGSESKAYDIVKEIINTEKKSLKMYTTFEKVLDDFLTHKIFAVELRQMVSLEYASAMGNDKMFNNASPLRSCKKIGDRMFPSRSKLISISSRLIEALTDPTFPKLLAIKVAASAIIKFASEMEREVMEIVESNRVYDSYYQTMPHDIKQKLIDFCKSAECSIEDPELSSVTWDAMHKHPLTRFMNIGILLQNLSNELNIDNSDYQLVKKALNTVTNILKMADERKNAHTQADIVSLQLANKLPVGTWLFLTLGHVSRFGLPFACRDRSFGIVLSNYCGSRL